MSKTPTPIIESKISRAFELYRSELEDTQTEDIQSFLTAYAEDFIINWERENTLSIQTKYKKGVMYLEIKFKSKSVEKVKADQTEQPGLFDKSNVHDMLEHVDSAEIKKSN